ncbi:hypothetical protein Tco_1091017 [Tanacetum coccineum]|uniref:Uncharacterized protein n=1 Tax=Tanacetum coccineum TaxID=301880 RepID=A0ABQ5I5X8_9ASTR
MFHFSPLFVEFKKNDRRVVEGRKKSTISRLPLDVCSPLFGAPRDQSYENCVLQNKTLGGRGGESFWEGGDDFGVEVLRFHTCLTDILGFLEKLEWWFEQDIDKEEERFEGDEDGGEI